MRPPARERRWSASSPFTWHWPRVESASTPLIKALSNQKHGDLVRRYGPENIGLLTGDQSINGDAPVVVMTTEVLRNMQVCGVANIACAVLRGDGRGAFSSPTGCAGPSGRSDSASAGRRPSGQPVCHGEQRRGIRRWIQAVRGDTTVVVDEHRPVPLWQHVLVGKRLFDLFDYSDTNSLGKQQLVDPSLLRHIAHRREADRLTGWEPRHRGPARGPPSLFRPPSWPDVIAALDREGLLPAITFIFARGLRRRRQTVPSQFAGIGRPTRTVSGSQRVIDRRCGDLADADLAVLDYYEWREGCCQVWPRTMPGCCRSSGTRWRELFTAG